MINLNELARGGTICLSSAGLAIGGGGVAAQVSSPDAGVHYAISGILYHRADVDNHFAFTDLTQADETSCIYLLCLDAAGAGTVVQGTAVTSAALAAGSEVLHWPQPTADTCPVGAIRIVADGTAFTGGTTRLDDGDLTVTYFNLVLVPEAPLTS